jgi:hypothetical protein
VRPGGRVVVGILTALFRPSFWRKVVANRRAARAGLPKPNAPSELLVEGLGMASSALPPLSNARVQKGLDVARDLIDTVPDDAPTPGERPRHKGVR